MHARRKATNAHYWNMRAQDVHFAVTAKHCGNGGARGNVSGTRATWPGAVRARFRPHPTCSGLLFLPKHRAGTVHVAAGGMA